MDKLHQQDTDCYRLFHGTVEGWPGVTVDRYGPLLLIQSFHQPLDAALQSVISEAVLPFFEPTEIVYNDRSAPHSRRRKDQRVATQQHICKEAGIQYLVQGRHAGQDPFLFLDLRALRRWVMNQSADKSVLNLFAYTCGVSIAAAIGGARQVWSVDFSASYLAVGQEIARLNQLDAECFEWIHTDVFPLIRQLAGLPVNQRRKKGQRPRHYPKYEPQSFDLVILDPPRWAKSPFGTVDLIRDYQSLFKPALLATAEGGVLACTNNVAQVDLGDWLEILKRCAAKAGRPIRELDVLRPDADFPSPDNKPPLKMALIQV